MGEKYREISESNTNLIQVWIFYRERLWPNLRRLGLDFDGSPGRTVVRTIGSPSFYNNLKGL